MHLFIKRLDGGLLPIHVNDEDNVQTIKNQIKEHMPEVELGRISIVSEGVELLHDHTVKEIRETAEKEIELYLWVRDRAQLVVPMVDFFTKFHELVETGVVRLNSHMSIQSGIWDIAAINGWRKGDHIIVRVDDEHNMNILVGDMTYKHTNRNPDNRIIVRYDHGKNSETRRLRPGAYVEGIFDGMVGAMVRHRECVVRLEIKLKEVRMYNTYGDRMGESDLVGVESVAIPYYNLMRQGVK